ncbi:UBX domain-containing protein 8-like [Saccostrea echinata]|uniref:UBX domain-containing protein 8-like n=1 Tax=Saccostrea echinata TaxID=191078 RepID=UPI002A81AF5B|nr:UBX domain-containing protein 8-like [Saccostrea echinata]
MDYYGVALLVTTTAFAVIYFLDSFEPTLLLQLAVKSLLALGVATFIIQNGTWLLRKWKRKRENLQDTVVDPNKHQSEEQHFKEKIQHDHLKKAEGYKSRILIPREGRKRKQKENEFQRFMGPAWKGEGHELGGLKQEGEKESPNEAARHRVLPENINSAAAERARIQTEKQNRRKKIIELPEEPDENSPDCVSVCLRTPLGTKQRRFNKGNTIQHVLDYMTSLGFSQKHYTISTSFPRECLHTQREKTLEDMRFIKKVLLNVEEIE